MSLSPLISVIVPNYNHEKYLEQRIESILNQTFQNFEVILLDDCSVDSSVQVLNKYKNHSKISHFIINKQNSGSPFKQWFKGIDLAKGKYIWIAESDDYASPLFLSKVMNAFESSLEPDIVFTGTTNVDENNKDIGNLKRIEREKKELLSKDFFLRGKDFLLDFLPNYCVIRNASSTVLKKSIISSKSSSVINYKVIGDFYFWINLCLEDYSFMYLSEKLNFMRNHANTVRGNKELNIRKQTEFKMIHRNILKRRPFDYKVLYILIKHYFKTLI